MELTKEQLKKLILEEMEDEEEFDRESFDSLMKRGVIADINQAIDLAMSMGKIPDTEETQTDNERWLMLKYTGPPRRSAEYEPYKSEEMAEELGKWLQSYDIPEGGGPTRAEPKNVEAFYWSNYIEPQRGNEAYTKVFIQKTSKKNET